MPDTRVGITASVLQQAGVEPKQASVQLIFDSQRMAEADSAMFDADYWQGRVAGSATGRAEVLFIDDENLGPLVLRHYWRGGLPGRVLRDQYLYLGRERSRPFQEWRILAQAWADGVNVPRPVAARVQHRGLIYRGDLLMQRIENTMSLADLLQQRQMQPHWWESLALTIARCHQAGYWHADLNARNVLCRDGQWWLIDFDRAYKRPPGHWGFENIRRLKRSLDKLRAQRLLDYRQSDWQAFVEAWHIGVVGPG